ncbi:hypothetical protein D3C72_2439360 [compost metagenome]
MTAARPRMVASRCGTIPSVQPSEASTPARRPCSSAVDTVKITPVPGMSTTMSEVMRNSRPIMSMPF